jgi:hypothetical protein
MAKLLRQVFAVWHKDCDFDPDFETRKPAPQAAEAAPTEAVSPTLDESTSTQVSAANPAEKEVVGHNSSAVQPPRKVVTTTASSIPASTRERKLRPLNFARLREQVSIRQVLERLAWQPQSVCGAEWRGGCPIHETPGAQRRSFAVETEKNVYCCHRCGSEGNTLDLWIAIHASPVSRTRLVRVRLARRIKSST